MVGDKRRESDNGTWIHGDLSEYILKKSIKRGIIRK